MHIGEHLHIHMDMHRDAQTCEVCKGCNPIIKGIIKVELAPICITGCQGPRALWVLNKHVVSEQVHLCHLNMLHISWFAQVCSFVLV